MSCSHLHRIIKKQYDGTREGENTILETHDFGIGEGVLLGITVEYITFDKTEGNYWTEFGTLSGIYPHVKGSPFRQYVIILECGGRISGAPGTHIKIEKDFRI